MEHRSDFLVLGSGIAGLLAALELSRRGSVHLLSKRDASYSNTAYAQGGIAAVMDPGDSVESHVRDTLLAGAGLCDEAVVRGVVEEGPERIGELIRLGVAFTGLPARPDLGLEGGHSRRRILHAGDGTGREIVRALLEACRAAPSIRVFEGLAAVDLILREHPSRASPSRNLCLGAYALEESSGEVHAFAARATLLATGGAGKVYLYTSNPDVATGDGMAMAYRAGVELRNLEFVQFHPTCLYNPGESAEEGRRFLLSEALRGEGGRLVLPGGSAFMRDYDPRGELAPRDVVARAIDAEMKRTGAECVYLDMTHKPADALRRRFPNIYAHCGRIGLDMAKDPIPVVPAAHFFCGGVRTDAEGATELPGLYAVGETAHTGLHGANRLASNSLLEGAVFARRAARRAAADLAGAPPPPAPRPWDPGSAVPSDEAVVVGHGWQEIRRLMWDYVGIVRTDRRLQRALQRLRVISAEVSEYYWRFLLTRDLIELRNIALLAELIVSSALAREESRGLHFNADRPEALPEARDTVLSRYGSGRTSLGNQEAARI